jgi:hypothetical protein
MRKILFLIILVLIFFVYLNRDKLRTIKKINDFKSDVETLENFNPKNIKPKFENIKKDFLKIK